MINDICKKIKEAGGTAYYVGGYVRDKLLNRDNKDIDIEVHGIDIDTLKNVLSKFGTVDEFGKSFGVIQIHGLDVDWSIPRKETKTGDGHKDFDIEYDPYIGIEGASRRRDFCMNAIMQDVLTGEVYDPFEGVDDIRQGIIRHIDDKTFVEDPLRVLRAAQFASRFGFNIDPITLSLCKNININTLPKERIFEEVKKALLKSEHPSIFFEYLKTMKHLEEFFPELADLIDCKQNSKFHREGDVWTHTMMTIDFAAKLKEKVDNPLAFMLSALFHDIGKPITISVDDKGEIHNLEHGSKGVPVAIKAISRLTDEKKLIKYVTEMVRYHEDLHQAYNGRSKQKTFNKIFDRVECSKDLAYLAIADSKGKIPGDLGSEEMILLNALKEFNITMSKEFIMGRDLLIAGYKAGPEMGPMLELAHKLRLAGVDKDTALKQIMGTFPIN